MAWCWVSRGTRVLGKLWCLEAHIRARGELVSFADVLRGPRLGLIITASAPTTS